MPSAPRRHHLDPHADRLLAADDPGSDEDALLTPQQLAAWLGVSPQWVSIGRHKGYGPPFRKLGPRLVKYQRGDVRKWLKQRKFQSTSEYDKAPVA